MLVDMICLLDDDKAGRILSGVCMPEEGPSLTPELADALVRGFGLRGEVQETTGGDLARAALLVLSHDPAHRDHLVAKIQAPAPECCDFVTATAVITSAVFVLKSYISVRPDKDGKYHFEFESQPLPIDAIRELVAKLLGLAPGVHPADQ